MLTKLTERIYYMPGADFSDRPYIYYIRGDEKSLVVEAGESANHVAAFYRELVQTNLPRPDYTVVTHWHWDHTFGLHASCGQTIASAKTNAILRRQQKLAWTEKALLQRMAEGKEVPYCAACMRREYPYLSDIQIVTAQTEIPDGGEMRLDLGGVTCQIMQRDTTHTRDALLVYIPEERALAVSDADYEDYYDNDYRYDQQRLAALTELISGIDFDYYLRGHAGVMTRQEALNFLAAQRGSDKQSGVAGVPYEAWRQ